MLILTFHRRRERHAKTIDIAQEEVLTCLGLNLFDKLQKISQKLKAEEQTWDLLFHLGTLRLQKSFEVRRAGFGQWRLPAIVIETDIDSIAKFVDHPASGLCMCAMPHA